MSEHLNEIAQTVTRAIFGVDWDGDMGEITGCGDECEAACRKMVTDGVLWLIGHPDAEPRFAGLNGKYGAIAEDNREAKELREAVKANVQDATAEMISVCIKHVLYIKEYGTQRYIDTMKRKDPVFMPDG